MSDIAITVRDLSKQYLIAGAEEGYKTLRESIVRTVTSPARQIRSWFNGHDRKTTGSSKDSFWALRNISLDVRRGEVVGLIGRNGAGKSTLLKVLSRITEPTEGMIDIHGRMSSLLEVGTGFHAELSGRENVFLNGAIMGMKRAEIERRFDEIVAFAEVERFVDTPVKHYSSGMYLRLAFAVAAHLEPEILIVDEVLAVGDANFQKKCLNKMESAGRSGRTVLFVSHNLPVVTRLCPRAILLEEGKIVQDGLSHRVVSQYLSSGLSLAAVREWHDPAKAPHDDIVRLRGIRLCNGAGEITDLIDVKEPISIEVEYDVLLPGHKLVVNIWLTNDDGVIPFVVSDHHEANWRRTARPRGVFRSRVVIPGNFLAEGRFIVGVGIVTEKPFTVHCQEEHAVVFEVTDPLDGESVRGDYSGGWAGVIRPMLSWNTTFKPVD